MRVKRQAKVAEEVAGDILNRICSGEFPVDSRLPSEAEMLADYGVGRASLRESLRILEIHGIVRIKAGPGGGPVVMAQRSENFARMAKVFFQIEGMTFAEVVEARLLLEPFFARMAALKRDPEYLDQLMQSGLSVKNDKEYLASSRDFHRLIGSMSSNRLLNLFAHALADIFHERVVGVLYPDEERHRVEEEHRAIAQAIEAGEADRAEELMRKHMEGYSSYVSERYPALLSESVRWMG